MLWSRWWGLGEALLSRGVGFKRCRKRCGGRGVARGGCEIGISRVSASGWEGWSRSMGMAVVVVEEVVMW